MPPALSALLVLLVTASPDEQVPRRGAVPVGLSLTAALGVTESIAAGGTSFAVGFSQEAALAWDLSGRWTVQLALRVARGISPATISVSGGVLHRFALEHGQRFVPFVGAGLTTGGVAYGAQNGLGFGLTAEGGLELRVTDAFAVVARASWTSILGGLDVPQANFLHQTLGVTLSL